MDWIGILDEIKEKIGAKNDAKLAAWLNITPQQVAAVRSGSGELPGKAKLLAMEAIGRKTGRTLYDASVRADFGDSTS